MTTREKRLFALLAAIGGLALWVTHTKSGREFTQSAALQITSGVHRIMDITDSTLQTIIKFEGFSAKPYRDAHGWSIGYGHFMGTQPDRQSITRAEAYELLREDAQIARNAVTSTIKLPMTQNEFDAMVSLAYNIGARAFANSTVARKFNAGDKAGAADAFKMWNKSQGAVLPVLVARRESERNLFLTA